MNSTELLDLLHRSDWAIISAARPGLSRAELDFRHEDLKAEVLSYYDEANDHVGQVFELEGVFAGESERSLLVVGLDELVYQRLGELFGQEAILLPHCLLFLDDTTAAVPTNGEIVVSSTPFRGDYSRVAGEELYFQFGLKTSYN
jgi:hypothetical protein